MSKNYILTVVLASVLLTGGYLVWRWSTPHRTNASSPSPALGTGIPQQNAPVAQATPNANISIIPATLNDQGIPAKLGTLSLTQTITGTEALAEVAQLHGTGFDLVGGYKAYYGKDQAILWVGQAKDRVSAQTLLDEMAQKIGPDNAMFKNLQPLNIGGRTLYSASGQGQQHFFYAVSDKIVWLAASPDQAADILHSLWSAVK